MSRTPIFGISAQSSPGSPHSVIAASVGLRCQKHYYFQSGYSIIPSGYFAQQILAV
jgi:hypothetical protein